MLPSRPFRETSELRRHEGPTSGLSSKTLLVCLNRPKRLNRLLDPRAADEDKRAIQAVIRAFFDAGKNKDLTSLAEFHSSRANFTKFDENPPFTRQNSDDAFVHEQAAFANISDYEYAIDDLRVDLFGDLAVATFYLTYKGMFVNDYSFEGSPVSSHSRVTMVMQKAPPGWRIAHEHFSRFPDWVPPSRDASKPR
jgi:ketosteroid isomerase-like protein